MTSGTSAVRETTRIVTAHRQREGAGFIVRRPFPTQGMDLADPFLLLDEMGPAEYGPGEAVGAPDHPHRGFETITYMLEGEFEHSLTCWRASSSTRTRRAIAACFARGTCNG